MTETWARRPKALVQKQKLNLGKHIQCSTYEEQWREIVY